MRAAFVAGRGVVGLGLEVALGVAVADVCHHLSEQRQVARCFARFHPAADEVAQDAAEVFVAERKLRLSVSMPTKVERMPICAWVVSCASMPSFWSLNHQPEPNCTLPRTPSPA